MYVCSVFVVYTIFSSDTIYRISLRKNIWKTWSIKGIGVLGWFYFLDRVQNGFIDFPTPSEQQNGDWYFKTFQDKE